MNLRSVGSFRSIDVDPVGPMTQLQPSEGEYRAHRSKRERFRDGVARGLINLAAQI